MISSSQRPLPDNTQHSQQTDIHTPGGIRTRNLNRRAASDLRLRPCGHWVRRLNSYTHSYSLRMFLLLCLRRISSSAFVFPLVFPPDVTDTVNALTVFHVGYFAHFLSGLLPCSQQLYERVYFGFVGYSESQKRGLA